MTKSDLDRPLLESGVLLETILNASADAIVVVDERGLILSFNPASERLFGCSEHDAVGTALERFVPQRFLDAHRAHVEQWRHSDLDARNPRRLSTFGLAVDSHEFPCEAWASQQNVAGQRQLVVFFRDITDRLRSEEALRGRTDFETFLFELSSTFIGLPEEEVDADMKAGLARIAAFLQMDRITLLELTADRTAMLAAYSWSAQGVPNEPARITSQAQPWWMNQVLRGEVSLASHVDDLPTEAAAEKEYLRKRGIASAASIPVRVGGEVAGAISFVTVGRQVSWDEVGVGQLKAIGDILWNALKRRRAMQALRVAQEEERARIARELHDDISQRLTLLLITLETVRQRVDPAGELSGEIGQAIETTSALATDIQGLSRRLHQSAVTGGLASAALDFCHAVSERNRVDVRFETTGDVARLPEEVSLCVYRVLQEAVQNAVKHSGARDIDVTLQRGASDVTLTVHDSGSGFVLDEVLNTPRGLGLISMKERLMLVLGELTIDSAPERGTTIRACVPLTASSFRFP